ncbi:selenide, water dikinase SelD [Paraburkholderia sp. IMGN_8]|uniref:selenide, water dikinase SelD n=1 Tax=Paraburkholderia sp. IMGN_8 TaxID=3136564 RepID=UPI0031012EF1
MHSSSLTATSDLRLTELAHGGGCGCKIAPELLRQLLSRSEVFCEFPDLLVGTETSDDAAVYKINDTQAIVATTDFFMPIVDDPFEFGRIAATNALSDVYAMGGRPLLALAITGMPINKLAPHTIASILEGGGSVCASAGIPVAGGHSIDSVEPIYGLAAIGLVNPNRIARNSRARAGDVLVLGKPLGVGVLSAALKKRCLSDQGYKSMLDVTTQLNRTGTVLGSVDGVHAMTDVTGFGVLGHLLEICRGARLEARLTYSDLRWMPGVIELVEGGMVTGASGRNWKSYGADVTLADDLPSFARDLLTDPQTSGGLLVACDPSVVGHVVSLFHGDGFADAAVIGELVDGEARVKVN